MKINFFGYRINLKNIVKVYPVATIQYDNDITDISLEWLQTNKSKVKIIGYRLIIIQTTDTHNHNSENYIDLSNQIKISFLTFEHLVLAMEELHELLLKIRN